jgi:hypothetical protein
MIRATTEQGANSSGRAEIKLKDTKKQVEKAKKNSAAACPRSAERARYDSVRSAKVGAERHQHLVLCLCPHAHLLAPQIPALWPAPWTQYRQIHTGILSMGVHSFYEAAMGVGEGVLYGGSRLVSMLRVLVRGSEGFCTKTYIKLLYRCSYYSRIAYDCTMLSWTHGVERTIMTRQEENGHTRLR